ncbi:MAG: GAF domain-containing protein [Dehalococcoidia bacterium]
MTQRHASSHPNGSESEYEAILGIDDGGGVIFATREVEHVFGYPADSLAGTPLARILPGGLPVAGQRSGTWHADGSVVDGHISVTGKRIDGSPVHLTATLTRAGGDAPGVTILRLGVKRSDPSAPPSVVQPADRLTGLASMGTRSMAGASIQDLYDQAAELLRSGIGADCAAVLEYGDVPYINVFRAGAGWGLPPPVGSEVQADPRTSPASLNSPVVMPDLDAAGLPSLPDLFIRHGIAGLIAVAIRDGGGIHGSLAAYVQKPRQFSGDDVSFAQSISNVLSAALLRQRSERILRQESLERTATTDIARIVSTGPGLDAGFQNLAAGLSKIFEFDLATIHSVNISAGMITLSAAAGSVSSGWASGEARPLENTFEQQVLRHGRAVALGRSSPDRLEGAQATVAEWRSRGIRSLLAVPLVIAGSPAGLLIMGATRDDAYTHRDAVALERIVPMIAGAALVANCHESVPGESPVTSASSRPPRHVETATGQVDADSVLALIGRTFTSSMDVADFYEEFVAQARKLVPCDRLTLSRPGPEPATVEVLAVSGQETRELGPGSVLPVGSMADPLVATSLEPTLTDLEVAVSAGRPAAMWLYRAGLKSVLNAPVVRNGSIVGILSFFSFDPEPYGPGDMDLAERICAQIAGAFGNIQTYAITWAEAQERAVLAEIGRIVTSSLDVTQFHMQFAEQVRRLIPFDRIVLNGIDNETGNSELLFVAGEHVSDDPFVEPLELSEAGQPARQGEIRRGPANGSTPVGPSSVVAPVIWGDRVIGSLECQSFTSNAYSQQHLAAAQIVCAQIAGALANFELHRQLKRRALTTTVLASIGRTITASTDITEVYERFAGQVSELIPFDRLAISKIDAEQRLVTALYVHGTDSQDAAVGTEVKFDDFASPRLFSAREAFIVSAGLESAGGSRIYAPIVWRDRTVGCIEFSYMQKGAYTDEHRVVSERIAAQIAGAFMNAQLLAATAGAERSLRESQARLRTVLANAPVAVAALDCNGVCTLMDGRGLSMFNMPADMFVGKSIFEFTGKAPEVEAGLRQALRGLPARAGLRLLGRSLEMWLQPVLETDGTVGGVIVVATDVTERMRAASARAEVRQLQLTEEERTRFMSAVSHELRTPLTSIVAFTDILTRNSHGNLEEAQIQQLNVIQKNADRLNDLISDLLDLSRMEGGSFTLNTTLFDVKDLLEEIEVTFKPVLGARDQDLRVHPPAESLLLRADPERITQVLSNLLSNASKYSPEGTTVTVTAAVENGDLEVTVSDEGPGIPPRLRSMVFNAFYRVDNDHTRSVPGTGLGLAIVQRLVELHGGKVSLDSKAGGGTTVSFTIPGVHGRT